MTELAPTLAAIAEAVQVHASEISRDGNVLLVQAVVVFECVSYDESGEPGRRISYTIPTENFSLSGALGLMDAGRYYLRRDILHDEEGDE